MNLSKIFFLLVSSCLLLASCSDLLNPEPAQSISDDLALSSDRNVKAVLIGAYGVTSRYTEGFSQSLSEILAADGDVIWERDPQCELDAFNHTMIASGGCWTYAWQTGYNAVNICNNILEASSLAVVDEADRDKVKGEALFLRALNYFELIRLYAPPFDSDKSNEHPGIPLVLELTRGEVRQPGMESVGKIYEQIIADLTEAEALLPGDNGIFASKGAAAALLARVYLQMSHFAAARDAAARVIDAGNYSLLENYPDEFNRHDPSPEDIFAIEVSGKNSPFGSYFHYHFASIHDGCGGGRGHLPIQQMHLDLYEPGDNRLDFFCRNADSSKVFTSKWNDQFANVTYLRLAEMYLIRAEANLRLGAQTEALADYNQTRKRAGLGEAADVTLEEILLERQRELSFEGFKLHDRKRNKQPVVTFAFDDCHLVLPIPESEINVNPNLAQNTEGGCY